MDDDFGEPDWAGAIAERRILEAQEQGVFDNLPGQGRPIEFDDDAVAPHVRAAHKVLRNAGALPSWISMQQDVSAAKDAAEHVRHGSDRTAQARADYERAVRRANDLILKLILAAPFLDPTPVPFRLRDRLARWDAEAAQASGGGDAP